MMLDLLLDLGWKSTLIAGFALLLSLGVRALSASERVMVLRAAVAALLMLPLFALAMPALELAVLPAQETVAGADPIMAAAPDEVPGTQPADAPIDFLLLLYGTGVTTILGHLIAGMLTLRRWTRLAVPSSDARWLKAMARAAEQFRRPVRLRVSPRVPGPLSWGLAPAWLLIGPATENCPEQAEAVIAHEMAHVRRFDWPVLIASRIVTALFWYNPLAWLLVRTLARQTELAADDEAVRHVTQIDYAQTLLTVASPVTHSAACGMTVSKSMLAGRIRRVLDAGPRRSGSRLLGAVLLIAVPAAAAPLAAMQLVPAAPSVVPARDVLPAVARAVRQDAPVADRPEPAPRIKSRPARRVKPKAAPAQLPRASRDAGAEARRVGIEARAAAKARRIENQNRRPGAAGWRAAGETRAAIEARTAGAKARWAGSKGARAAAEARTEGAKGRRPGWRKVDFVPPVPSKPRVPDMAEKREVALRMTNSAIGLRIKATSLEAEARNPAMPKDARQGNLEAARAMRSEADRRDKQARRMIFGP